MASEKLVIDFGNAQTKIYKLGAGLVLSEPTIATVSTTDNKVKAVGNEAKKLLGKTASDTKIVYPIFEGEVVSDKVAVAVLNDFIKKTESKSLLGVNAVMSVPCGVTSKTLKQLENVASSVGVTKVHFVEAPILSALGQNLTLTDFSPYFIIDMGAGTTNVAAVSLEGVIAGISVNIGGNGIDTAIIDFIAENYGLQIGVGSAEKLKIQIGSLIEHDTLSTVVNGRDVLTGKPRAISVKASDIREVILGYYDKVAEVALKVLAKLPPEVSAEIRHAGLYVSGGPASVFGLEDYYAKKFGMQISIAENPQTVVAFGGGQLQSNPVALKKLELNFN